jgi:preprotein translocase subunit SecF
MENKEVRQINWMKYRPLYFTISLLVIVSGLINISMNGFNLGIDFSGGSELEYSLENQIPFEKVEEGALSIGVEANTQKVGNNLSIKSSELSAEKEKELTKKIKELAGEGSQLVRFENVGPSISRDLVTKTLIAVLLASASILIWVAYQFKNITYGVSATLATCHDALVLIGVYSILGTIFNAKMDFLFVTAVLTTLSFSVHDTIVVYDRIRELRRKHGGNMVNIANRALSETMRRSVYNSLTIIFMLVSLIYFGGSSITWFAAALLVGVISGTYSSPFVAVPILLFLQRRKSS